MTEFVRTASFQGQTERRGLQAMLLAESLLYPVPVRHREKKKKLFEKHILLVLDCFNSYFVFQLKMLNASIDIISVCACVILLLQHIKLHMCWCDLLNFLHIKVLL